MLSERTIINGLITLAGLILGPYLVVSLLEGNEYPFFFLLAFAFLLVVFFVVQDGVCVFPLLALFFSASLSFLPLGLSALEVASLVLILYYSVTYLALRQRTIRTGPRGLMLPLFVLGAIVLFHEHSFGLHIFGSTQEGSRPALEVIIAIITYFCAINIPSPSLALLRRLPLYCVITTCLSSMPFILTTYVPSLAPFLYHFTTTVNVEAYFESAHLVEGEEIGRSGYQSKIGAVLEVFLVSYFPIYTWWRPSRWWVAFLFLLSFYMVMSGGYRSGMGLFGFVIVMGALCYSRWVIFMIIPAVSLFLAGLNFVQDNHPWGLQVPLIAQRTLSFLPADWDLDAVDSAQSSNDFRNNIQQVYIREYLDKSPWIGNGFTFDPVEAQILQDLAEKGDTPDRYYEAKAYIITKTFHTGWISLYDAVGLIGSVGFIILGVNLLLISGHSIFAQDADPRLPMFPVKVWIFCNIAQSLFGFFTVFGDFSLTLAGFFAYAIILVHLDNIERRDGLESVSMYQEKSLGQEKTDRLFLA